MPMWGGYWGGPWTGFGWLFSVIALLLMGLMMFLCFRMMGRMGCWGHGGTIPSTRIRRLENCAVRSSSFARRSDGFEIAGEETRHMRIWWVRGDDASRDERRAAESSLDRGEEV